MECNSEMSRELNELNIYTPEINATTTETIPLQTTESQESLIGNSCDIETIEFISYEPNICTREDIDDEIGYALNYQYCFNRITSPWEMEDWDQDELRSFKIEIEKIDRIYRIYVNIEDDNFRSWWISCRMHYKGEKYFVDMLSNCESCGFECQGEGTIRITKLPDFFLNHVLECDEANDVVYQALLKEGYNVQEPDPLQLTDPQYWKNVPMLKYMCHYTIYNNRDVLSHYKEHLPRLLSKSVDDFIKVKEWKKIC